MRDEKAEVWQGTLALMVLKTLQALGELHGYGISRWIEERTRGVLEIEDAALYKSLHRLERGGSIEAEWGVSENNRKAKFYRLTRAGLRQVEKETREWQRTTDILARFLAPGEPS